METKSLKNNTEIIKSNKNNNYNNNNNYNKNNNSNYNKNNYNKNNNNKFNTIKIKTQKYIEKREKKDICYDILAWIGSILILSAYIFNLTKKEPTGFLFNTFGSLIFIVVCYDRSEYQIFTINFVWFWGTIFEFIKGQVNNN